MKVIKVFERLGVILKSEINFADFFVYCKMSREKIVSPKVLYRFWHKASLVHQPFLDRLYCQTVYGN